MKNHGDASQDGSQPSKPKKVVTISERKLKANRENAKKSTGPKTARGKDFSRRNAVTHGLFVDPMTDFLPLGEDPKQYEELWQGLWDHYQPVGQAEEIEVDRIALCCWRLKRAWRYENAANLGAMDCIKTEVAEQLSFCKKVDEERRVFIAQLLEAKKQIADTGQISDDLKQKILASPRFGKEFSAIEEGIDQRMKEPEAVDISRKLDSQSILRVRNMCVVTRALEMLEPWSRQMWAIAKEMATARHAIPKSEELDKILRYETTIEKQRSRAIVHLERLQRRRLGEFVPPPLRMDLG